MSLKSIIILIAVLIPWTHTWGKIKPTFHFTNKNATMPVVVRGNVSSKVLIVFLHGGPGGTAMTKIGTRAFASLEEDYGIVYWDQRGANGSSGGTQKKWMNLSQYVEDLDVLVDQLKNRYHGSNIYLMGHDQEATLAAYGRDILPAFRGVAT